MKTQMMDILGVLIYLLNFFFLDRDLKKCAQYHGDKHLNKMQLEYAQIGSSVWWNLVEKNPGLKQTFESDIKPHIYRATHKNHPIVKWATQSEAHLTAVITLGLELAEEKKARAKIANLAGVKWKEEHASSIVSNFILEHLPPVEAFELGDEWRDPPACMPEEYAKMGVDIIDAYRFYYLHKMESIDLKWEPYAQEPEFIEKCKARMKIENENFSTKLVSSGKMEVPYKGEKTCVARYKSGEKKGRICGKPAYYLQDRQPLCGRHSDEKHRVELKDNPKKKEIAVEENESREKEVLDASVANFEKGLPGRVCCSKLHMRSAAPHVKGFQSVFPNFKHGNRSDGVGLPSLSPMSLGPVKGVGRMPEAKCLENWWQGQKLYEEEIDKFGNVSDVFFQRRDEMFADSTPHRRKEGMKTNVDCFLWTDNEGNHIRYKYVPSRQFYCNLYERLSAENSDLTDLRRLREDGLNINIIGYDGFDFEKAEGRTAAEKLMTCYLDPSRPFGHEMVIVCLLLLKKEEYPWVIHKTADF